MSEVISPRVPIATEEDYMQIQGGKPAVTTKGELTVVTHNYPGGDGMQVSSHIDHGMVVIDTPNGPREFEVDLLRQFHGDPCEKQSKQRKSHGDQGYKRVK
jgi:hypothetical protein